MAYYPQQTYQSTPYNPTPSSSQGAAVQYSPQGSIPTNVYSPDKPPSPVPEPIAPTLPAITPAVASQILQRLLSSELRNAGFDSAEPSAMHRLELDVVAFIDRIFDLAQQYANHANRSGPIATDLLLACRGYGIEPKQLRQTGVASKKRKREGSLPANLDILPPPSRSPSPELLDSDDEGTPTIPATLRRMPHYIPALPPKHTYLRTPIQPPKKAAMPSLEKKLQNAALVQDSLQNLLLATEDSADQEDGELLGAIVNWESTSHPRKRWRINS